MIRYSSTSHIYVYFFMPDLILQCAAAAMLMLSFSAWHLHHRLHHIFFKDSTLRHVCPLLFVRFIFKKTHHSQTPDQIKLTSFPSFCMLLSGEKKGWCFTCEFESLILKAKDGNSPLSPSSIISHLESIGSNLGNGREEDAHEFLRYIFCIFGACRCASIF